MAICRYCGRYNDITEWPGDFQEAYVPHCCFKCFTEDSSRLDLEAAKEEEEEEATPSDDLDNDVDNDDGFEDEYEPDDVDPTDDDDGVE